ncbi:MAG TPA: HAMP domain-containing sensor histidine kinase [Polyangiaceae bacterium]|nr:HAMP domain-containing sensor histidine kinase [Polyangiaceae bacterium]
MHGIFLDERDDALAEIAARRRALEQYAHQELEQRLRARLAEARPTLEAAATDPLIPASGLWLVENGVQRLPRTDRPLDGSQKPAEQLYRMLRDGHELDALAAKERQDDADSPWAERLDLLAELERGLAANDRNAIEKSVRAILAHRASYVIDATRDIPFTAALLRSLADRARPHKSLMEGLLRDGFSQRTGPRDPHDEGLQRALLRHLARFTRPDFEALAEVIVELSRASEVLHADFAARAAESPNAVLPLPDPLVEPMLARGWYVEPPQGGKVRGVSIDLEPLLSEITAAMREHALIAQTDHVSGVAPSGTVTVASVVLDVESPSWAPANDAVHGRYRLKAALEFVIAALVFGVMILGAVIYRRRHRFLELKSDFVSAVSHELRTPLASIRLMAETLERRAKGVPRARDYATRIVHDIDALSFLVENILSFNRLSRNRWVPKWSRVRLHDIVDKLEQERDIWARRRAEVEARELDGIELDADADLLALLLTNLARNACQYNEREPAIIVVSAQSNGGGCVVRVADNGIGIPDGERERVFDDFYRSSEGKKSGERGSGLGLAICRKIMEAHGGTIRVAASSPEGTTFELRFPPR